MFRLALALGMTVEQLLNNLDGKELTEWSAFERLEPFGDMPLRYQLGEFMSMFYNAIPTKRKKMATTPEHFVIGNFDYLIKKTKQTVSQIGDTLKAMMGKKW